MNEQQDKLEVVVVGGGMITHDQILPSLYQLQRNGVVGGIKVCALNPAPLRALAESPSLKQGFPGHTFEASPPLEAPDDTMLPDLYREVIAGLPPRNLVVVAVPDHVHGRVIRVAMEHDQHVMAVKPLVPTYAESV